MMAARLPIKICFVLTVLFNFDAPDEYVLAEIKKAWRSKHKDAQCAKTELFLYK
jgi:hypothetical protein